METIGNESLSESPMRDFPRIRGTLFLGRSIEKWILDPILNPKPYYLGYYIRVPLFSETPMAGKGSVGRGGFPVLRRGDLRFRV